MFVIVRWINEAGMWLAIQSEVQDEAAKLKEAMEVSLREQQAAREAEEAAPPIALLSEERLRKKFPGSAVLARLDAVLPSWVLFSERMPLREKVKHKVRPSTVAARTGCNVIDSHAMLHHVACISCGVGWGSGMWQLVACLAAQQRQQF
jgi:hypothetical protein